MHSPLRRPGVADGGRDLWQPQTLTLVKLRQTTLGCGVGRQWTQRLIGNAASASASANQLRPVQGPSWVARRVVTSAGSSAKGKTKTKANVVFIAAAMF